MKNMIAWSRDNWIIVASVVVIVLSLGVIGYVHLGGSAFTQGVARHGKEETDKLRRYLVQSVEIPGEKADDAPRHESIPINQAAINDLEVAYGTMNREFADIYKYAVTVNSQGHTPMMDGLFPDIRGSGTKAIYAKDIYLGSFDKLFEEFSPASDRPQLDAGPAPDPAEVKAFVDRFDAEYRSSNVQGATLTRKEDEELRDLRRQKTADYLIEYARGIHLYATTDRDRGGAGGGRGRTPTDAYPFQLMQWASETSQPDPTEVWEGQMQMWITEDIMRAIALTNRVQDPGINVMTAPIKRLISLTVLPDYVGITGQGGINQDGPGSVGGSTPMRASASPPPGFPPGMGPGGGQPGPAASPAGGPPGAALGRAQPGALAAAAGRKLPDDFTLSPTGRRSNDIYDVRHVWLSILIDSTRTPEFFDNLAQVNFMTVLKMKITDEDEYKDADAGYIYGACDVVRIDMLIETLWLRDWTARLMPDEVRKVLAVNDAPAAAP